MRNYYGLRESVSNPSLYVVSLQIFPDRLKYTEGSFALLAARLLNLSYANYLRLCRDVYGATLAGKGTKYPVALFKDGAPAAELIQLLNQKLNEIVALCKE